MEKDKSLYDLKKSSLSFLGIKQEIKKRLLGPERPIKIMFGIAKGIWLILDPMHKTQFILGLAEAEISRVFKKFTRTSDIFFDIGAASGYYSLIYRKWNKTGEIHLFEPDSMFLDIQRKYFEMNGFTDEFHQHNHFVGNTENTSTLTMDGMVYRLNLQDKKLFFKIDVDGGEVEVLRGAHKTLLQSNCKLIIETHSLPLEEECISMLQALGYTVRVIKNAWWRFVVEEIRPIDHNRWLSAHK